MPGGLWSVVRRSKDEFNDENNTSLNTTQYFVQVANENRRNENEEVRVVIVSQQEQALRNFVAAHVGCTVKVTDGQFTGRIFVIERLTGNNVHVKMVGQDTCIAHKRISVLLDDRGTALQRAEDVYRGGQYLRRYHTNHDNVECRPYIEMVRLWSQAKFKTNNFISKMVGDITGPQLNQTQGMSGHLYLGRSQNLAEYLNGEDYEVKLQQILTRADKFLTTGEFNQWVSGYLRPQGGGRGRLPTYEELQSHMINIGVSCVQLNNFNYYSSNHDINIIFI